MRVCASLSLSLSLQPLTPPLVCVLPPCLLLFVVGEGYQALPGFCVCVVFGVVGGITAMDGRLQFLVRKCGEVFGEACVPGLEDFVKQEQPAELLNHFFGKADCRKLFLAWYGKIEDHNPSGEGSSDQPASLSEDEIVEDSEGSSDSDGDEAQQGGSTSGQSKSKAIGGKNIGVAKRHRFGIATGEAALPLTKTCRCVYFLKSSTRQLSAANIEVELLFGVVQGDVLGELKKRMESILLPALRQQSQWGHLTQEDGPQRMGEVFEFLEGLDRFVASLGEATQAVAAGVELRKVRPSERIEDDSPANLTRCAKNPVVVERCEGILSEWRKQLQIAFAEGTAVRSEPDNAGPRAELEYWKARMAKFNGITEQLRSRDVKTIIGVLQNSKSRVIPKWMELDKQITDAANEAKDNVKYLYTLEKFSEPLYRSDPEQVEHALPGLINSIRMIHSISRYYNTSERLTSLFVKITNQMIGCCKAFIRKGPAGGKDISLWEQDKVELVEKFHMCIDLFEKYKMQYSHTKYELQQNPTGKQFDCSEAAIFGKFDVFCRRLHKLIDIFGTSLQFGNLEHSVIEGVEPLQEQYKSLLGDLQKRHYDFLDHRRVEFEDDYVTFNGKILDLEKACANFIEKTFSGPLKIVPALELWKQFKQAVHRESLTRLLDNIHLRLWQLYGTQVQDFKSRYERHKNHPPMPRDFPPVAGSIAWSRQMLRKLETPMKHFQTTEFIKTEEGRRIVRIYNSVARALVQFEAAWYEGWCEVVDAAKDGLLATLLVVSPDSGNYVVNFDSQIMQLTREIKLLREMGMEIPESAEVVFRHKDRIKQYSMKLHFVLKEYNRVKELIRPSYARIVRPLLSRLDDVMAPGLVSLTWSSLNIDGYVAQTMAAIGQVEQIFQKANDLLDLRLDKRSRDIASSRFINLSHPHTLSLQDFLQMQEEAARKCAYDINLKSLEMENATDELIHLLTQSFTPEEMLELRGDCVGMLAQFQKLTVDSTLTALRQSVLMLKQRISSMRKQDAKPLFKAEVHLNVPDIVLEPSLDEMQICLNQTAKAMLLSTRQIFYWGQDKALNPEEKRNLYFELGRNRQIVKIFLQLTGASGVLKKQIIFFLNGLRRFEFLWTENRKNTIKDFVVSKPELNDFEMSIDKYHAVKKQIDALHHEVVIGSLMLEMEPIKGSMIREAEMWKTDYGRALNVKVKGKLDKYIAWMDETMNKLNRTVTDLEDVNHIMSVLANIREKEPIMDMKVIPIEEAYHVLLKYHVTVPQEELEEVESVQRKWVELIRQARLSMDQMVKVGPGFKHSLELDVKKFVEDARVFKDEYISKGPNQQGIKPRVAVERLNNFKRLFAERQRKREIYTMGEGLFNLPQTEYPELDFVAEELDMLDKLYSLYTDVLVTINGFEEVLWGDIDVNMMTDTLNMFQQKCRRLPKQLRDWEAFHELKATIDNFLETLPLLTGLACPFMQPRHWETISKLAGVELSDKIPDFRVRNITEAKLYRFFDDVEEITNGAVREADIEEKINKVEDEWIGVILILDQFKNRGELMMKPAETSELMMNIEDAQMALGSMLSNKYNAPFRSKIQKWVGALSTAQETLELWLKVQSLWIYLEAVFSGGDIARQLPQEAKRFAAIDKSWCKIMGGVQDNPNMVKQTNDEQVQETLTALLDSLEFCQKSLAGYLEQKRQVFPRFYFVSDAQLLEILGQGSDPNTIQNHLLSIFTNIARVVFDKVKRSHIHSFVSAEGETIKCSDIVVAEGNIEDWLNRLVTMMQVTIKDISRDMATRVHEMLMDARKDLLEEFTIIYPAQLSLLGLQLFWTHDAEIALEKSRTDRTIMASINKKFQEVLSHLVDITTQDLSKSERTKIETLITIHIHQVDIFADLVKARVRSPQDFDWLKQTRFYWKPDIDDCMISVTDVDFLYNYEYMGCTERLVITPLTDRIYISCSQAMGMYYGGAPAGPAGTGKTETTKDMGRTVGKYFIVINCSDQMDFRAMGKLYKGIAQSGCWCGMDEINRVELEVLSVVASQIQCLFQALRDKVDKFKFTDGTIIPLDLGAGVFITMNPGYAGRTELPENMKALFRTIAVVVPDRQIIMRVRLAASGFQENTRLAKKFFVLYRLCEEQLSKQTHYDFGLRNILSVLRTAGATRRSNATSTEVMILMRVLRDMNVSKMVEEDEPLFHSLIDDLFPGITVGREEHGSLQSAVAKHAEAARLINSPGWNLKLIQMFEQWRVRHGLCLMGPSGAGKSTLFDVLAKALSEVEVSISVRKMNPKAITATQMFGRLDPATNDWTDGIFSALWRRGCASTQGHSWIILDGPVDAVWIENLNTVLDDTKTLTLANGDRIAMPATMKLLFEVADLNNASPATVSRMGMVFMGKDALGWHPVVEAWAKNLCITNDPQWSELTRPDEDAGIIKQFMFKNVGGMLLFLQDHCESRMVIDEVNMVSTTLRLFKGLLPSKEERPQPLEPKTLERLGVFALCWGLGGLLELADRRKVHEYLSRSAKLDLPETADGEESVYDYFVSLTDGMWHHWSERVQDWNYPKDFEPPFASILVPTVDNVRTDFLIDTIAKQRHAVLLIGESGTAKTVTIQQYIGRQDDRTKNKQISFSSATTPNIFQRTVEAAVEKRMGNAYGPPMGTRMIIFIDDVNMPEINTWGDQITNELTRQLLEESEMYNLEKPGERIVLQDVSFLAAMNQPGGGRNDIPSRLKRHFAVFNVTLPSQVSIEKIYGKICTGYFIPERKFPQDVVDRAKIFPRMTRILWERTKVKMLPTPTKFHYIFNLRDLSRIFQGLLRADCNVVKSADLLLAMWKHECDRVLPDKFNDSEDVEWFNNTMREVVAEQFNETIANQLVDHPRYFVNFMRDEDEYPAPENEDDPINFYYEPIPSFAGLQERLEYQMGLYNEKYRRAQMSLVLFEFAMHHLIRISRIITTPGGNALLVGVGGSGKQSLTRLASFIANCETFQVSLTRGYGISNFTDDLKALYMSAGLKTPTVFLFTDNEIKEEAFLEYINMILCSGEIPGLFAKDELEQVMEDTRVIAKKKNRNFEDTPENLYKFFINRVKENLHVVLCFSPVGEKFRVRSRKFPGLISGCTIDWFTPWPYDALHATAQRFLSDFEMACDEEVKANLVTYICSVHDGVNTLTNNYFEKFRRRTYVTPKSYLSFIDSYKKVYTQEHFKINELAERIRGGLQKLKDAGTQVSEMKIKLIDKERDLVVAQQKAAEMLKEITASRAVAEKKKNEVQAVKTELEAKAAQISAEASEAEAELAKAKPALEKAEKALESIKPNDITQLKSLGKPPQLIKRIMDCVLILQIKPLLPVQPDVNQPQRTELYEPSWKSSVSMMSDLNFLKTLLEYPRDAITDEMCELLAPYFAPEDYNVDAAKKASGSLAGLCTWTQAMPQYHEVAKFVAPKQMRLMEAQEQLDKAMGELRAAEEELAEKQRELDLMQANFDRAMAEKQRLEDDAELTKRRLSSAEALIGGLEGERVRWTNQSKEFDDRIRRLTGDVAIACAFLSYSGPFNQEFRDLMLNKKWGPAVSELGLPHSRDMSITKFLADETTVGEWNLEELPTDELSVQNGIIVTSSSRYPLLIDPQGQGKNWLKKRGEKHGVVVTNLNNRMFRQHLEDALQLGTPLIIEDVGEELDPVLDPVLEKQFVRSGSKGLKVKLGDKELDVMDGFNLYLTTKLGNPNYTPETFAKVSIIDFAVTLKGLEDQLLGIVILKEKHELEEERQLLLEEITENKKKIAKCESDLLHRLSHTTGSLVDDDGLIEMLANTKATAREADEKLAIASKTEEQITQAREEFRPVATRGSILYFVITELGLVNYMYSTSLAQFLTLFVEAMTKAKPADMVAERIANIIEFATFYLYKFIQRGLYEKHKPMYRLLLALKIQLNGGKILQDEFNALLRGGGALDLNSVRKKVFSWIPDASWLNLVALSSLNIFSPLLDQIAINEAEWRHWYELEAPENGRIPDGYDDRLDLFRRMLLVRSWREDRTTQSAVKYVMEALGPKFVDSISPSFEALMEETAWNCPVICLLSMGSDPTVNIVGLANRHKIKLDMVSMGQGQEVIARELVKNAMEEGGFVLLQNCHLGLKFLVELEEKLMFTDESTVNKDMRIWITSEPTTRFPINLLQMGIKVTNEPPQGIRAGLQRSYDWIAGENILDIMELREWKQMLYTLCFLHSVVIERKKFGPLGWCIQYEFNHTDLAASEQFLCNHLYNLDPKRGISWKTVKYMVCDVQYGGRITDDLDSRLLKTYGEALLTPDMFQESFEFSRGYNVPLYPKVGEYLEHIKRLPIIESPEVMGLHPNAELAYNASVAKEILGTILDVQPKDAAAAGGESRETIVLRIVDDLQHKCPPPYHKTDVNRKIEALGGRTPLNIFLSQEIDRMQLVILEIRKTLEDLKLAIAGTIIMSPDLQDALNALFDARVPPRWLKVSWDSPALGYWFADVVSRAKQYTGWLEEGAPNAFWLTGFFNPQGFLTAVKQETTRKNSGWALDAVIVKTEVMRFNVDKVTAPPEDGVYIYGLFLEGAAFSTRTMKMEESAPKVLFCELPVIHITAINTGLGSMQGNYVCPVYRLPRRNALTYVFDITLKTDENPDHWILRGVAALCSRV